MTERAFDQKQVIAVLTQSVHGDLASYLPTALNAVTADPDFYAHLTSWNHRRGQIRDAKIALPIASLMHRQQPAELTENALALLADLPPRLFTQALDLARQVNTPRRVMR